MTALVTARLSRTELPVRVDSGKVIRVHSRGRRDADVDLGYVDVNLDLGYGIKIDRCVQIDGVNIQNVLDKDVDTIHHFLIVLLGGKNVLVQSRNFQLDRPALARVFLNEKVYGCLDGMMFPPHGMRDAMLDVGQFYQAAARNNYDLSFVKGVLNGGIKKDNR